MEVAGAHATVLAKDNATADLERVSNLGKCKRVEGFVVRQTKSGAIAFFGTNFVTTKLINLLCTYLDDLEDPDCGLHTVHFRMDGYPRDDQDNPTSWMYFPDSNAAVCNLRDCFELAIDAGTSEEVENGQYLNSWYGAWIQIIQNFFHEVHHSVAFAIDRESLDCKTVGAVNRDAEEKAARAYAKLTMCRLAKTLDIEPEYPADIHAYFHARLLREFDIIADTDEEPTARQTEWAELCVLMADMGVAHHIPKDGITKAVTQKKLRDYIRIISEDPDSDQWKAPVCSVVQMVEDTAVAAPPVADVIGTQSAPGYILDDEDYIPDDEDLSFMPPSATVAAVTTPSFAPAQTTAPTQASPGANPAQVSMPSMPNVTSGSVSAPAAQTSPAAVNNNPFPAINMPVGQLQQMFNGLYTALVANIYSSCGYQFTNPQTPAFAFPGYIKQPLANLDPNVGIIFKAQTRHDGAGTLHADVPFEGWASGVIISDKSGLPGYQIVLSGPNGEMMRRKLLPQNPWKVDEKTGQYSGTAQLVQKGNQLVWIINEDTKEICLRVFNGQVQHKGPDGRWTI